MLVLASLTLPPTLSDWLSVHGLDFAAMVLGFVYIYQEYRASIWLWLTGIVMPVVDIFLYYRAGLYADFGMAIYYTVAGVYGFAAWKFGARGGSQGGPVPITHISRRLLGASALLFVVAWAGMYAVLVHFTNSTVPVLDSFGNSLSIVGLWWLARKYVEQWFVWIVADVELSALYAYKGLPFKAQLYGLYVVIAVMGYFEWRRMMQAQAAGREPA